MSEIDHIDKEIARLLSENARQSSGEIAKKLKLSGSTVRHRIKKLIRNNSLRIVGIVEANKFGLPLHVIFALDIYPAKLRKVTNEMSSWKELRRIAITTGRFDIIAMAHFPSNYDLALFIQNRLSNLEGLKDLETYICIDEGEDLFISFH